MESRISQLESKLSNARVLSESQIDTSIVRLLTKVTIRNTVNNMQMTYAIVSESEANLAAKKISAESPIGKGLLGRSIGDIVNIQVPNGMITFEILSIDSL